MINMDHPIDAVPKHYKEATFECAQIAGFRYELNISAIANLEVCSEGAGKTSISKRLGRHTHNVTGTWQDSGVSNQIHCGLVERHHFGRALVHVNLLHAALGDVRVLSETEPFVYGSAGMQEGRKYSELKKRLETQLLLWTHCNQARNHRTIYFDL
jgi:hypothetical protein